MLDAGATPGLGDTKFYLAILGELAYNRLIKGAGR